jgi:curved DNA-binding protein CbpA
MPRRAKSNTLATQEIDLLLANKMPLLDGGADHFTLLGLPQTASPDEIQKTYFMLARKLHPDRLSAIGVADDARNAQRLMAEINAAFAVLNDPAKRDEYLSILARGGEAAIRAEETRADDMAMRVMRAEEIFRQGEMALRRDQLPQAIEAFKEAVALQPNEAEYQALLAWAQFASATDKNALANPTRKALTKAIEANERSVTARFYLGRVERMLGKEKEALDHFREVLRIKRNHTEAASEARILEQRLKGKR